MQVLFVASEAVPFSKTGGLADVAGSLPAALAAHAIDARTIVPHYRNTDTTGYEVEAIADLSIPFDGRLQRATLLRATQNSELKTQHYLLDAPQYFDRDQLYGYEDDILRFGFFCRATLRALTALDEKDNFKPQILHCHDWHTGLLAVYLKSLGLGNVAKTVFTIHNLVYQGLADFSTLARLGLPDSLFNYHQLEFYNQVNPLKGGLVFSDAITTVSPTYAREIQTPQHGAQLEGVLAEHAHQLHGIINGIDYGEWNPTTDKYLAAPFSAADYTGKKLCKADLQQTVGLPQLLDTPLIGMVSRLSSQKGFDLVLAALENVLALGCQLVLLGDGDDYYKTRFHELGLRYPLQTAFVMGQRNEPLAHKIYAGSDLFLMPSQYEPCGLSQMISLAYGTIPIVRSTGGLADTIHQFNSTTREGNGFVFHDYNTAAMLGAISRAIECYHSSDWPQLIANAFESDFSWNVSARDYAALYRRLIS